MTRIVRKLLTVSLIAISLITQAEAFEGIYSFSGVHSERGRYNGVIELRGEPDGSFSAVRLSTYETFRFRDLRVQEVWTGTAVPVAGGFAVSFTLRQADFLKAVGSAERTPEQFQTPISFQVAYSLSPQSFAVGLDKYFEVLTSSVPDRVNPEPVWREARYVVDATGESMPAIMQIPYLLLIAPIVHEYRSQPYAQEFARRREFRKRKQFVVRDSTDLEFYRANRDTLRVPNKIVDSISLTEAYVRRNAFAFSLTEKAAFFDRNMQEHHINEFGMFTGAQLNPDGSLAYREPDGDSALWTGMYAGAQAMRYLVTRDPEALANFKKTLRGVMLLMDVTRNPAEFARFVQPYRGEELAGAWRRGEGEYSHIAYIEGGNNDMYKGVVHAFAWAFHVLPPEETELWAELRSRAARVAGLKIAKKLSNRAHAEALKALATREPGSHKAYAKAFRRNRFPEEWGLEHGFYYGGISDSSGINLGMVSLISSIVLAETVKRDFPFPRRYSGVDHDVILAHFRDALMENWKTYERAKRDFVTVAAHSFAYRNGGRNEEFEAVHWEQSLAGSLASLREVPMPRGRLGLRFDYSLRPDWCLSAWPVRPWKKLGSDYAWDYYYQGAYEYPLFESIGLTSTFLWKDGAFNFRGDSRENFEPASTDYLYVYWTARYGGLHLN